jgi:Na+/melibiose symporter-like transporter
VTRTDRARALSLPALVAFGSTNIPIFALQLALSVHLPRYFASHMGLSLATVGAAFALVRAIDIPLDPALGMLMDRTRTRLGRYRPWAIAGAPVLMSALYLLMHPPGGVSEPWLVAVLLAMFLGYSAMFLAQLAWAAEIAPDYQARSRLFAVISALGVVGAITVLIVPVALQRLGRSEAQGVEAMIWFVILATPAATALMTLRTAEPLAPRAHGGFTLADYARLLARRNVLRLLASDLCIQLGPNWMAALYLFYFTTRRGFDAAQANLLLLAYVTAGFLGAPLTAWLSARIEKHRALIVCTTAYALAVLITPLVPKGSLAAALPVMLLAGMAFTGFLVLLRALAADIADEVRLETGREWTALIYALMNATTKLASAAGVFFTFRVLARVGFDPREGATNSAAALRGLEHAFLAGPAAFVMAGGLVFLGYRLDHRRHADIRRQLAARAAALAEG